MTVFDEQTNKFGKTCKWLDYDSDCHCTICVLNRERRHVFEDRCREIGLKYGFLFSLTQFPDYCRMITDNYSCFDGGESKKGYDEECYMTESEKEAEEIAKKELSDNKMVKEIHKKAKEKYIIIRKKEIEDEVKKLNEIINS